MKAVYFLLPAVTVLFLAAGNSDYYANEVPATKAISQSSLQSPPQKQPADQIWVVPVSRIKPSAGGGMITPSFSTMLQARQVFEINGDGTFELNVKAVCTETETRECLGYLVLLVNPTKEEQTERITGLFSRDGKKRLVTFPVDDPASRSKATGQTSEPCWHVNSDQLIRIAWKRNSASNLQ